MIRENQILILWKIGIKDSENIFTLAVSEIIRPAQDLPECADKLMYDRCIDNCRSNHLRMTIGLWYLFNIKPVALTLQ